MCRPRSSSTQPKPVVLVPVVPVKLITSPGLIERSISSTKPLTKFAAIACRPKPRPRPIAPEKTVSAVRSTPDGLQPHQHAECDQEGVGELADADARGGRELLDRADPLVDPARDPDADDDEDRHRRKRLQHRPDGDTRALPFDSPIESSVSMTGSSQPSSCAAISTQMMQRDPQLPGLDHRAAGRARRGAGRSSSRISASHASSVQAVSSHGAGALVGGEQQPCDADDHEAGQVGHDDRKRIEQDAECVAAVRPVNVPAAAR